MVGELYDDKTVVWYHTYVDWDFTDMTYEDATFAKRVPVALDCLDCGQRLERGKEVFTQNRPAYRRTLCIRCVKHRGYVW